MWVSAKAADPAKDRKTPPTSIDALTIAASPFYDVLVQY